MSDRSHRTPPSRAYCFRGSETKLYFPSANWQLTQRCKSSLDFARAAGESFNGLSDSSTFPKNEIETLWSPWRVEYFEKEDRNPDFLTDAANAGDDAAHLVITRRKTAFLMMNRYPYAVGHLMAVPYRKTADPAALGENEIVELWQLAVHAQKLLRTTVKAQGFNIGLNLGTCAGAGVPDHMHLHIVPRWNGDTNFMPILSDTRQISEGLESLFQKLVNAQGQMAFIVNK
ncbi:MAG: HIT domain-containing protein [Chthoniobacterales bacterium]|nr:HIT domain-containing protein [Chthoniobacterales bacterium]